ncbi:EamA family transporter [Raineyella fluvialis]|uniref:EamA family transporter n=1 Tax=Raineyella fluvialis TaxID=2662261 RepID=UPI003BB18261
MDRGARQTAGWPLALVLTAIVSVQFGGALGVTLIPVAGVMGAVLLRLSLAAAIMMVAVRPHWRGHRGRDWWVVAAYGLTLAVMNSAFYGALARLPIGVAVTLEFLGPLTLAAVTSRSVRDLSAVALALGGVLLISGALWTPWAELDLLGIGLALLAGAAWAAYIIASGHTARRFGGIDGVAWAMLIAAVLVAPWGALGPAPGCSAARRWAEVSASRCCRRWSRTRWRTSRCAGSPRTSSASCCRWSRPSRRWPDWWSSASG